MHIVITGASSGIGEALALRLARGDNKITLVARREELLKKLAARMSVPTLIFPTDLSALETCTDFIPFAEKKFGPIDMIINNAGIQLVGKTVDIAIEDAEKLLRVNVMAPFRIVHKLLPKMLERNQGIIVNVASIAAFNVTPFMYYYTASKAALGNASEALCAELKDSPIHVLTVYPGPISTPMEERVKTLYTDTSLIEHLPTGSADDLADEVAKAIERKANRLVFPPSYQISRLLPTVANWLSAQFTPEPNR